MNWSATTTRSWLTALVTALVAPFATDCRAAIDSIVPLPKRIQAVGEPIPLGGFRIVAASDERSRIGAAEINERITSLGGQPLTVSPLEGRLPEGRAIVIAPCSSKELEALKPSLEVTPEEPGTQGYRIEPIGSGENFKLMLVGSDSLGTLYAAVTCRQLIVARNGQLLLEPARVRDWPDFQTRCNGTPFSENLRGEWYGIRGAEAKGDLAKARELADRWVASQKRYFDWLLRAKINMAWNRTHVDPGDANEKTTIVRAALKEIHQYGWKRGILAIDADTTAIGRFPQDQDNPDFNRCVLVPSHHRYFCWSRLDYHQRRAERAARWLADCGYRGYYLHATDSGGWDNPALWDDRCDECRKNYGDDHAKADATVFGIYHRALKQRIPEAQMLVVVYPYTGRYLDPEYVYRDAASMMGQGAAARHLAEQTSEKLTGFLERLDSLLPADVAICIRESERGYLDLARRAWGRRPFFLYYEYAYWKGWRPYYLSTPLMTRSLYFPGYDDILFGNIAGYGWRDMTQLLGAECAWHVNRPGAREFDSAAWREWGAAGEVPDERSAFALRACRFWFGEEAGPMIAPAFAENISHHFICFPEQVMDRVRFADPVRTMHQQAQAADRAVASLDKLWDVQRRSAPLSGNQYAYFLNLYQMTHAARILAVHRAAIMEAQQAIRGGDRTGARRQLAAALAWLDRAAPAWSELNRRIPRDLRLASPERKVSTAGLLSTLDPAELREEVEDLAERCDERIAAHTIPGWFQRDCTKRDLVAGRITGPITVDGRLDEASWSQATRIEHFVDRRKLRLESLETVGRLVYDDRTLYVAMECFDPNPSEITTSLPAPDQHRLCDSIEVWVASSDGSQGRSHWVLDSRGTVLDAREAENAEGEVEYTTRWNSSAQTKVTRSEDRWTVELAIPRDDTGIRLKPGSTARLLLCRNIVHTRPEGEHEENAVVFLDGKSFRAVEKFAKLRFSDGESPVPQPQVEITLRPVDFGHETTGDGSGTYFGGEFFLETDRNLHDVRISVEYTDGVRPLGRADLGRADRIPLRWSPKRAVRIHIPTEVPGVACSFVVESREGTWSFPRRFGNPRRPVLSAGQGFAPGIDGQALAMPAHFSSLDPPKLNIEEGTLEFWIRPSWEAGRRSTGPRGTLEHALVNIGPIRPDHLYLSNHSSLTLSHTNSGSLSAILSNRRYEARTVGARTGQWQVGQWHHVALQWKLDDAGKTAMALYFDGRLASDHCYRNTKNAKEVPLEMKPLPFPVQIGSMNTGFRPADAAIDELRISSVRRYEGPFVPSKRFATDGRTLALFHFDGDLEAETPAGCRAVPGPVQ